MRCEELSSESYLKPGTIALSLSFEDLLGSLSPCSSTKVMSIDNKVFWAFGIRVRTSREGAVMNGMTHYQEVSKVNTSRQSRSGETCLQDFSASD